MVSEEKLVSKFPLQLIHHQLSPPQISTNSSETQTYQSK